MVHLENKTERFLGLWAETYDKAATLFMEGKQELNKLL